MALDVYLTDACNLKCKYCFNWDREDAPRVPLESICTILKTAYQLGNRYVSITGGEPFIYRQIFEVLDFAHDLGYWITILSHGGLLDSARIDRLKKYWRLRVRISIDGPDPETHDNLRGKGTFDLTISKIEDLVQSGINVGVGMTVSEQNVQTVDDVLALCLSKNVSFVRCVPVSRVNKGKAAQVTRALHQQLLTTLIDFGIRHQDRLDLPEARAGPMTEGIPILTTRRCMAGKRFFGIKPNTTIVPCPLIAAHPSVPQLRFTGPETFEQIGREMDALFDRLQPRLGGICSACEFREVCCGGCLAEKLSFERELDAEQPICTKLILEGLRDRYDARKFDRIVQSWVAQIERSLEPGNGHACMRQAPYWSVNFQRNDRWNETPLRFN